MKRIALSSHTVLRRDLPAFTYASIGPPAIRHALRSFFPGPEARSEDAEIDLDGERRRRLDHAGENVGIAVAAGGRIEQVRLTSSRA
jgi:hypothetical protein